MRLYKLKALEVFGAILKSACSVHDFGVCAGHANTGHRRKLPSVALQPVSSKVSTWQEDEWLCTGGKALIEVGTLDTHMRIEAGSKNVRQRASIEETIMGLFFRDSLTPGILSVKLPECDDAIISFELLDSSWRDEAAFTDKWFSYLSVNVVTPMLVSRTIPSMDRIVICTRSGVAEIFADVSSQVQECVLVAEDGSISITTLPVSP